MKGRKTRVWGKRGWGTRPCWGPLAGGGGGGALQPGAELEGDPPGEHAADHAAAGEPSGGAGPVRRGAEGAAAQAHLPSAAALQLARGRRRLWGGGAGRKR